MGTFPTKTQVVDSILEGIKDAHKNYVHWTNNDVWLNSAPEYMMNMYIGQHLAKFKQKISSMTIWFEVSIDALAETVKASSQHDFITKIKRNRNDDIEKNQTEKIDIVLDDELHSRVIIEVKNNVSNYTSRSEKDIIRICNALSHGPSLEYGIFTFFAVDTSTNIDAVITNIENSARKTIETKCFNINLERFPKKNESIEIDTEYGSCSAVCFVLRRK